MSFLLPSTLLSFSSPLLFPRFRETFFFECANCHADIKMNRLRLVTNILLFTLAIYAAVYGVTYAYVLHQLVNGLCAWLALLHFSGSTIVPSSARLGSTMTWGVRQHGKKRP